MGQIHSFWTHDLPICILCQVVSPIHIQTPFHQPSERIIRKTFKKFVPISTGWNTTFLLEGCNGMNACVSPKFVHGSPNPRGGGTLVNRINVFIKGSPRALSSLSAMWGHNKKLALCNLEEVFTRTWPWLTASKTLRNKFLSFISHLVSVVEAKTV